MRIPNTSAMLAALKSKDKTQIKTAADSLKIAADKYFASVPFPEVERIVAKKCCRLTCNISPQNNVSVSLK